MPITVQLAAKLKAAAKGRADDAPLLVQSDGSPWGDNPGQRYHRQVDKVVTAIGLDPAEVTMYCLATFQHRPHAAAKCADQAGGVAAQHQRRDDRKALFEVHHRAFHRRHHARRTVVGAYASRRQCGRDGAMKSDFNTKPLGTAGQCRPAWRRGIPGVS